MAPSSQLPGSTANSAHFPQHYQFSSKAPAQHHAQASRPAEQLEPAAGFSLLHTIHIGGMPEFSSAHSTPATTYSAVATMPAPQSVEPSPPHTQRAEGSPPAPHVVQHCDHELRRELGTITARVFDIIGGRRRINDLRRIDIDPMIHAAVITLAKNASLKGVSLQSFHASVSSDGKKVEFLGSCRVGPRARAFTGTFRRRTAKTRPWVMTAFRVL
ncbi:MAG: hypothetical protein Q4E11_06440 [Corynebacterium sp.]|uniref:hypothetical protein n=1 Tax=Corynebacterium sp. TaxID=1720 RepID=UPI0026DB1290|nr:hypothetical protein [Corynebacterium sp.]MDO5030209.1 hypothetical protein [Corynebacterium sp.]